jgi:hypothetical protein
MSRETTLELMKVFFYRKEKISRMIFTFSGGALNYIRLNLS